MEQRDEKEIPMGKRVAAASFQVNFYGLRQPPRDSTGRDFPLGFPSLFIRNYAEIRGHIDNIQRLLNSLVIYIAI
jgi:hypothetical protein